MSKKRDWTYRRELPTMQELQAAANRLADRHMDALARIALKCLESGAFKGGHLLANNDEVRDRHA